MDFFAEGVGWVPGDPSVAIADDSALAGFGRESTDMVIMHFDLIRFQRQYHWLQGIGAVRSINRNDEGSTAGMSLEAAMTVETCLPATNPSRGVPTERIQEAGDRDHPPASGMRDVAHPAL